MGDGTPCPPLIVVVYNQLWQNISIFFVKWEVLRETFAKEEVIHLLRRRLVQKEGVSFQ